MVVLWPRSVFRNPLAIKISTCQPKLLRGLKDGLAVVDICKRRNSEDRMLSTESRQKVEQEAEEGQDLGRLDINQEAEGSQKQEQEVQPPGPNASSKSSRL